VRKDGPGSHHLPIRLRSYHRDGSAVSRPAIGPASHYDLLVNNSETSQSRHSRSSGLQNFLIATTGRVLGNLLTVIIVFLLAGPFIKRPRESRQLADEDSRRSEAAAADINKEPSGPIDTTELPDSDKFAAELINDLLAKPPETGVGVPPAPQLARPSMGKDLFVATTGQVFGSLLTAIIIYLVLVAGSVIKGSTLIIGTIIVCVAVFLLIAVFGFFLWRTGARSNNYTQSINGKKALLFVSPAVLVIVPMIIGLLFLLYLAIKATGA
jgi:hypothetical protein